MNLERAIFEWLNSWAGKREWLDTSIIFRAQFLGWWLAAAFILFLFFGKDKRRELWMTGEAFFSALAARFGIAEAIRFFYNRPRPFELLPNIYQLLSHSPGGSFPSGHAVFFFALATTVFLYHRFWGIIFYLGAISLSLSRVAAGLHWPLDVLGGAVIGVLVSLGTHFLSRIFKRPAE